MTTKKKREEGSAEEDVKKEESAPESTPEEDVSVEDKAGEEQLPTPDFSSFIFSISTTVLMDLGEIEHPIDKEKKVNIKMAKHSIDVLDMIKDKTKGNLSEQEGALIENIVTDLKLRYCEKIA